MNQTVQNESSWLEEVAAELLRKGIEIVFVDSIASVHTRQHQRILKRILDQSY